MKEGGWVKWLVVVGGGGWGEVCSSLYRLVFVEDQAGWERRSRAHLRQGPSMRPEEVWRLVERRVRRG
jgi:hypothetical protein